MCSADATHGLPKDTASPSIVDSLNRRMSSAAILSFSKRNAHTFGAYKKATVKQEQAAVEGTGKPVG